MIVIHFRKVYFNKIVHSNTNESCLYPASLTIFRITETRTRFMNENHYLSVFFLHNLVPSPHTKINRFKLNAVISFLFVFLRQCLQVCIYKTNGKIIVSFTIIVVQLSVLCGLEFLQEFTISILSPI